MQNHRIMFVHLFSTPLEPWQSELHSCVCVCMCLPPYFFLSRNSSSLKMPMNRIRRTCRVTWTEWSPTPGNWNLKSRTMRTRVRMSTQHMHPESQHLLYLLVSQSFKMHKAHQIPSSAFSSWTFINILHFLSLPHSLSYPTHSLQADSNKFTVCLVFMGASVMGL